MGFDTDMRKVSERLQRWVQSAIIDSKDFAEIDGKIQRHYDDRARLFDDLQNALKRDKDIQDPWDSLCDKGSRLTDDLNSAIASKVPDGFRGLGMSDFYEGEKKAWESCKNTKLGSMAEGIFTLGQYNLDVYRRLDEDLKKSREDAKVIDELARAAFGDTYESVRGFAVEVASTFASTLASVVPGIGKVLAPKAKTTAASLLGGSKTFRELARKKAALKKVLVDNSISVVNAKTQIGDGAIDELHRKAQDAANSWKGAAARSDYNAEDWASFAKCCLEIMANKAVPAIEKAKSLLYTMQPMYTDTIKSTFLSLMSDPSSVENFSGKLSAEVQKMTADLAKENDVIAALQQNDPTRTAIAQMQQIKADVTEALKELQNALRESEELMKS